jgi:putative MFS transporter
VVWGATLLGIGFYASSVTIPILGFIASFTIGFVIPVLYTLTGESFPTRVRATGVSMSDGLGHLGGAFCGQIVLGAQALYGFQGAFITMAITGFTAAILVVFVRKSWIRQVE